MINEGPLKTNRSFSMKYTCTYTWEQVPILLLSAYIYVTLLKRIAL